MEVPMDSPKNYKSTKSTKKYVSTIVLITQILHGSSYGLSNQMRKYKSTKSIKVQNKKVQKRKCPKNAKKIKSANLQTKCKNLNM